MDTHLQQKPFVTIFLKVSAYLVLSFIIIWSGMVAYDEYDIYTTVPPELPPYIPPVAPPLTSAQKFNMATELNASTTEVTPENAAKILNSISKPKNTMTDEEKNKILQGLE